MPVVWIINHYAQTPSGPGGTRHHTLARHLRQHGWEPLIIASSCEHNTARQRLNPGETRRLERCQGVDLLWLRVAGEPAVGGWRRFATMLGFAFTLLRPSTTRDLPRPAVVIGSTVHPFAAWAGYLLARRYRVPFVFEVRDLWPRTLVAMGAIPAGGWLDRGLAWLERWLALQAARVIVLMQGGIDYFQGLGVPRPKLLWLPNGAELPATPPTPLRAQAHPFQLLYCGAHGPANALNTVLDAMGDLQTRGIDSDQLLLRLIGTGPSKPALQQQAQALGLTAVRFEEPVPKTAIPALAAEADAFVVAMQPLPELYRYGISFNKLFDYFLAGRPIVSASCAAHDPVAAAEAGLVVPAGDAKALSRAIERMMQMPLAERQRLGINGHRYLEQHHDVRLLAQRLSTELDCVLTEQ
jgi:glycosyltransferase involved in cell wall biosynthesis